MFSAMVTFALITSLIVGGVIAVAVVTGVLVVLARRAAAHSATTVDLSNVTVSRQWLMQHQSNDRS
jgi:hypothetical protein